jgi:hypothetical protein
VESIVWQLQRNQTEILLESIEHHLSDSRVHEEENYDDSRYDSVVHHAIFTFLDRFGFPLNFVLCQNVACFVVL